MNIAKKLWCRLFQGGFYLALPFLPYREPRVRYSLSELDSILRRTQSRLFRLGKRNQTPNVLIVTDQGLVQAGLLRLLTDTLEQNGVNYCVYADVTPNPTTDQVEAAREAYIRHGANAIIALGGGSAMDCAKAAACRIARPRTPIQRMQGILKVWVKLPTLIAIPTTAGTGSETTLAAVITDPQTHHKAAIMDFPLIPRYAVLDYRMTIGLPPHITSTTGMDTLVHAVEAYIGHSTTPYTRRMAIEAITLVHDYLLRAYHNGKDSEARQKMLRAAFCGGNAFTRSYVGYVHAVAHSLGGQYGTPHGLANAILLPIVLRAYGKSVHRKLAKLARIIGLVRGQMADAEAAEAFITWVEQMNAEMNIPTYVEAIRDEDIPTMAQYADDEANPLYPVPTLWGTEELSHIYHLAQKPQP